MATSDELLKQMYDNNLAAQKAGLKADYDAANANLDSQKAANQQQAQNNIRLTKTEADRSAVNAAEYYEAAGLSSGAKAQARVAQDNQLLADLTAIRAAQQQGDIDIERQRGLLAQQYAAAIREAQANNDMARAQALYQQAAAEEAALLEAQKTIEQRAYDAKYAHAKYMMDEMADPSYMEALGVYTAPQTDEEYWNSTVSGLKAKFPSGVVDDPVLWSSLVAAYGAEVLKNAGFRPAAAGDYTVPYGSSGVSSAHVRN